MGDLIKLSYIRKQRNKGVIRKIERKTKKRKKIYVYMNRKMEEGWSKVREICWERNNVGFWTVIVVVNLEYNINQVSLSF